MDLLVALLLIFTLPYLLWRLIGKDDLLALVVIQILLGIALGPGIAGSLAPEFYQSIFTPKVITGLNAVATWAVMLFICLAGIEIDLRAAWQARRDTLVSATLALVCPLLLGGLCAWTLQALNPSWRAAQSHPWQFSLGVGMACAVTALPILVLFLAKLGKLRTPFSQRVLRYASLDDLAIWLVLAMILMDYHRLWHQALYLLAMLCAAPLVHKLMLRLNAKDRIALALMWLLLSSLTAEHAGLHLMVGAFLAGLALDSKLFESAHLDATRELLLWLLMPVFFLSTGLRTNWSLGSSSVFIAAGALLVAAVAGKMLGVYCASKWLRWPKGDWVLIGWLLQTKALIMIIFANILLDRAIISAPMFTALLLMAIASTMLTIPMVRKRFEARSNED
jgi:Kef-type K+ transport system membrane component KefB